MNVVFDLGGVIVRWDADEFLESVFDRADTRERLRSALLGHPDWIGLDRGTLEPAAAIERTVARTGVPAVDIERLLAAIPPFLEPLPNMVDLVARVKKAGHRAFVLSNMHRASVDYLERTHDFWDLFDGIVFSCHIQQVKPEREIYEHLLSRFELEAADTVFIDDVKENIDSASTLGIRTIHFRDFEQCRHALVDHGVFAATA